MPGGSQSSPTHVLHDATSAAMDAIKGVGHWLTTPFGGGDAAKGVPHAALDPSMRYGMQSRSQLAANYAGSTDNSSHIENHIGAVNVITNATDAKGIAKSIGERLNNMSMTGPANRGLA